MYLIDKVKDSYNSASYNNYLEVREHVFSMMDHQFDNSSPSNYWKEEIEGFDYMFDASPLIINKLREHCYHLTGIKSFDYRDHHKENSVHFENKLNSLKNLDENNCLFVPEAQLLGGFGHRINGDLVNIDTPVKRYSSGMSVRLAFAIAAHLEPEILLIDEVLAVGDAEFQKKCLGKMKSISKIGRTVLFVSHNMSAIKNLCARCILLEEGKLTYDSNSAETVKKYFHKDSLESDTTIGDRTDRIGDGRLIITKIEFIDEQGNRIKEMISGEHLTINFLYELNGNIKHDAFTFQVHIFDDNANKIIGIFSDEIGTEFNEFKRDGVISVVIPRLILRGGLYYIGFAATEYGRYRGNHILIDILDNATMFEVLPGDYWGISEINRGQSFGSILIDGLIEN